VITSKMTDTIEHPDEPGISFTIRKLSHHQLAMAEDARIESVAKRAKAFSGIDLPEGDDEMKARAKAEAELPENKYDRTTVLRYGITEWTYSDELNEANVRELDESTAKWLFAVIVNFSTRSRDEGEASGSNSMPTTA